MCSCRFHSKAESWLRELVAERRKQLWPEKMRGSVSISGQIASGGARPTHWSLSQAQAYRANGRTNQRFWISFGFGPFQALQKGFQLRTGKMSS
jgi:hypothetical protein